MEIDTRIMEALEGHPEAQEALRQERLEMARQFGVHRQRQDVIVWLINELNRVMESFAEKVEEVESRGR